MTYEEWLDIIERLRNTNTNVDLLNILKAEPFNANLNDMLKPKLLMLFSDRFELSVGKIIKDLDFIFSDNNYLDLALMNLKKEMNYLFELIRINQIPVDVRNAEIIKYKGNLSSIYDILVKKADQYDYTGVFALTIKNNMIKWSDNNEL